MLIRFDDLDNYINERSLVIAALCCSIEDAWAEWESLQFGPDRIKAFQKVRTFYLLSHNLSISLKAPVLLKQHIYDIAIGY